MPLRGRSIQTRIEQLIERIRLFQSRHDLWRLFIAVGPHYYLLHTQNTLLTIDYLESETSVLQALGRYQAHYIETYFEPYVLHDSVIPLLYQNSQAHDINVFFHAHDQQTDLYVIDEHATLFQCQYPNSQIKHILNQLQIFLSHLTEQAKLADDIDIHYFELQQNSAAVLSCHPLPAPIPTDLSKLSIRVSSSEDGRYLTFYCNGESFSEQDYDDIFYQTQQFILSFRKSPNNYPCFISSIDVPCHLLGVQSEQQLQTAHYLNYKQAIEQQLSFSGTALQHHDD
jgi:adenylate cyclase class 1